MTQSKEVIIVYPNRHLRAKRHELNDMSNNYISMRSVQAMMKAGTKFQFIRETKSYEDVTLQLEKRIYQYVQQKGRRLKDIHRDAGN